jgi:hypothetical protein
VFARLEERPVDFVVEVVGRTVVDGGDLRALQDLSPVVEEVRNGEVASEFFRAGTVDRRDRRDVDSRDTAQAVDVGGAHEAGADYGYVDRLHEGAAVVMREMSQAAGGE